MVLATTTATVASTSPSPQVSPSVPLAFVLPSSPLSLSYCQIQEDIKEETRPEIELQRLTDTIRALRLSGW